MTRHLLGAGLVLILAGLGRAETPKVPDAPRAVDAPLTEEELEPSGSGH